MKDEGLMTSYGGTTTIYDSSGKMATSHETRMSLQYFIIQAFEKTKRSSEYSEIKQKQKNVYLIST